MTSTFQRATAVALLLLGAAACGDDGDGSADMSVPPDGELVIDAFIDGGIARECTEPGITIGDSCTRTPQCDDGCFCNGVEICSDGACIAGGDLCEASADCATGTCDEENDECIFTADDAACSDGNVCNGSEVCLVGSGCRPGLRTRCDDGDECTIGQCDPDSGCSFIPRDLDGDGFADDRCGGLDCNDDPVVGDSVFPGAAEICDNGLDDNCDGFLDQAQLTCEGSNDTCDVSEMLPGPGRYVRTTRGLTNDYDLSCRPTGIDAVFGFTLSSAQDVQVDLDVDGGNGAVAIQRVADCGTGADFGCASDDAPTVVARDLQPGDYVVVVKTSTALTYTLSLTYADPTPTLPFDVCDPTTVDISAGGTFTGLFVDVMDDYELQCRSSGTTAREDVAYRLEITGTPKDVTLRATTNSSSTTSSPTTYLSLVRQCATPDSTLQCTSARSTDAEIFRRSLEPGIYFVLIESSSSRATDWELEATITEAMPRNMGDACSSAIDITDTLASVPIDSLELDSGTSCGGRTSSSRDGNFFFTLTDVSDVQLESNVGSIHYTSLSEGTCGNPAAEVYCETGTPRIENRFLRLDPGTYYVTVSTALSSGTMEVSAMVLPPTFPPANDMCGGTVALTPGVEYRGDLLGAGSATVSCGTDPSVDVFHSLELTERKNVTVVARRTDGVPEPLALGFRSAGCDGTPDTVCTTGTPALFNRTLDPGTYFFVVESRPGFAGPYAITAYTTDP